MLSQRQIKKSKIRLKRDDELNDLKQLNLKDRENRQLKNNLITVKAFYKDKFSDLNK